jgi:hypothetical protein
MRPSRASSTRASPFAPRHISRRRGAEAGRRIAQAEESTASRGTAATKVAACTSDNRQVMVAIKVSAAIAYVASMTAWIYGIFERDAYYDVW